MGECTGASVDTPALAHRDSDQCALVCSMRRQPASSPPARPDPTPVRPLVPPPPACRSYVRAFVDAADDVGVGACVTLVVVDERGQVLLSEQVHTGGSAWVGAGAGAGSGATLGGGGSSGSGSITEEVVVVRYWRAALPASGGPGEPG